MTLADFDYELPTELIAQKPVEPRDSSRLMVVDRSTGKFVHTVFNRISDYLNADDLLVFNNTKVFPARLYGKKETGGTTEVLLLKKIESEGEVWEFIGKNVGPAKRLLFEEGVFAEVAEAHLKFSISGEEFKKFLTSAGKTPLPPYIQPDQEEKLLRELYQTVYAKHVGSAAAPTAGLHFTKGLLTNLKEGGVSMAEVTLHVGLGTFLPVKVEDVLKHKMHSEEYVISPETVKAVDEHLQMKKRVVAVGTTTVRTLESWKITGLTSGETEIFIYPGFKFSVVGAMVTNFHLPKSTLLMLVAAFAGEKLIKQAYAEAVKERYRFFSFGDAMLIV